MSDLQVDINGQETFSISKKIIASFSVKLRKMFDKSAAENTASLKLFFQDFPGGAEGFELIVRFSYNGGRIDVAPYNLILLHSAAKYLEIEEDQTMKYFESIHLWRWSDLLHCLRQCQELLPSISISSSMVEEILNAVVEMISMPNTSSPFDFSCSDLQFSGDLSTNSSRLSSFQTKNWLRDLEFLQAELFVKLLNTMISHQMDKGLVCSFLLHYHKLRFVSTLPAKDKCIIIDVMINTLSSLNGGSRLFPFRNLCDILQSCHTLKMGRFSEKKVERMIGLRIDEATLDDLLIPSPRRKACAYDVDVILRFLKIFSREWRKKLCSRRVRRVGFLMDLYLAEVAPDPHLKPCKFLALALALPDAAREFHDKLYEVVDMYFKVHRFMSEEVKIRICSVLNCGKLSSDSLVDLASNAEFPPCVADSSLVILQSKIGNMSDDEKKFEFRWNSLLSGDEDEQIVVHIEGKECRKVKKVSSDLSTAGINVTCEKYVKSLPRLCS